MEYLEFRERAKEAAKLIENDEPVMNDEGDVRRFRAEIARDFIKKVIIAENGKTESMDELYRKAFLEYKEVRDDILNKK
jgi:hypothetical protein